MLLITTSCVTSSFDCRAMQESVGVFMEVLGVHKYSQRRWHYKSFLEKKPKYQDKDLIIELKDDYTQRKKIEIAGKRKRKSEESTEDNEQSKEEESETKSEKKPAKKARGDYTEGLIIKFSGVAPTSNYLDLKAWMGTHGKVSFLEYTKGEQEGYARYADPETVTKAIEALKAENKEYEGKPITFVKLEGDDEKAYWEKIFSSMAKKNDKGGGGRKQKRPRR